MTPGPEPATGRDSKNVPGPHVDVAPTAWSAFVTYARQG